MFTSTLQHHRFASCHYTQSVGSGSASPAENPHLPIDTLRLAHAAILRARRYVYVYSTAPQVRKVVITLKAVGSGSASPAENPLFAISTLRLALAAVLPARRNSRIRSTTPLTSTAIITARARNTTKNPLLTYAHVALQLPPFVSQVSTAQTCPIIQAMAARTEERPCVLVCAPWRTRTLRCLGPRVFNRVGYWT